MTCHSDDCPRTSALASLRRLRDAVANRSGLIAEWRAAHEAGAKLLALGPAHVGLATRLCDYAMLFVAEVDAMIVAVDLEPARSTCADCGGFRCQACDHTGVAFEEAL